jgi:protein-S-isoprenylcysteine O-methyltransferase Ste14
MLGMLISGILWTGTLPRWPFSLVVFIIGTEIRGRVEDGLLWERFGAQFNERARTVPACLPFMR